MNTKARIIITSIFLLFFITGSIYFTGCKSTESIPIEEITESGTINKENPDTQDTAVQTDTQTVETEPEPDYYVSSSKEFDNYSFICPDGWELLESGDGERVILNNKEYEGSESIFIFIDDISADETLNGPDDIVKAYLEIKNDEATVKEFDEMTFSIDGADRYLNGYSFECSLEKAGAENLSYNDYFTFIEKNGFLYSIKYFGNKKSEEESLKTFKDFLVTFSINGEVKKLKEKENASSVNILILGDDSGMGRPGGRVNGRTDIIILLHLNLDTFKGTAVTIPRDTWVEIPGHGEGKINGAHAVGGNELAVKTIEELSGLEIDNYIITDFDGFVPLIDFLGGVTVEVGEDLHDDFSGCYLSKGVHHLDGIQALALSRNRHRQGDGTTQSGAFAREKEAAKIVMALLEQKSTFERIVAIPLFINYLVRYTWTDLEIKDIVRLLPALGKVKASDIEIVTIPSWPQTIGNASAVAYDVEATAELFEEIKDQ